MLNIMLVQAADGGLTLGRILRDIPHDASALVVYALVFGFGYMTWRGSRPKKST